MNQAYFHTSNLKVATALATLGFNPRPNPVTRTVRADGNESTVFWFDASHPETGQSAMQVFERMTKGSELFSEQEPEHPLNYIRAALQNRDEFVDLIRNTPRNVEIVRNGKRIFVSEAASEETKKAFSTFLK